MKSIPAALQAHMNSGLTTLCTCWKVTLTNGEIKGFTDHDQNVTFEGVTYMAQSGYNASAVDTSSELNPDNLEIEGFISSPSITDADIHSGKWDYAAVEVFEINFVNPAQGRHILRVGTLGEVKGGRARFTAEMRGLMQAYSRTIVRLTTKECTADLGDTRCKVNLASFTSSGTITAVQDNRILTAAVFGGQAATYYTGGLVRFTSGANEGLGMEVRSHPGAYAELHEEMPFPIAIGDTFTVYAGCQKRLEEDCKTKFNNVVNFRGFPHLPGSAIYKVGGGDTDA